MTAKILKPIRKAAAGSATATDLIESLPGFAGSGGVCGVAVAMYDEPWSSAFFDDRTRFGVAGEGMRLSGPSTGSVAELLRVALTRLPPLPPVPGEGLYLDANERGVLEPGQECLVLDLLEDLRRPRRGTVQLDIIRDGPRRAWEMLALVDDDRGRHLAVLGRRRGGRRLWWLPGTVERLAEFVEGRVPEHA
ncbi:hypothetical protein M8542_01180 [Amycolatopsis sp. OK19-0408]|uniref:Uncharacterized protein n=1 Tax=Amycolatopsis iheyensis TaxID=2945988 RepID=A0A9X2SIN1_9PSEU|nr:hypothetical protein [Amycolatopsis iheyensis]MCR6481420.1 hypothetical protein [Amycolatopsis iheyensis]